MVIVTPSHNARETIYTYENDVGAIVAERFVRTALHHIDGTHNSDPANLRVVEVGGWRVRLYTSPDDSESFYGLGADMAERMCLEHASQT